MQTDDGAPTLRSSINVTPLADVMLVLVIIFMVVTPMMGSGIDVQVPEAVHATEHPDTEETLVVSLKGDGSVYINEDDITRDDLLEQLAAILSERADKVLWMKADESLDYGYVLEMMDGCAHAQGERREAHGSPRHPAAATARQTKSVQAHAGFHCEGRGFLGDVQRPQSKSGISRGLSEQRDGT